jgi:2'-hydroxyisoflavone reductase
MRLLVVGGTRFLGRHLVDAALARGDAVTLFNRGLSGPVPDGIEHRAGDRRGDLSALATGEWDCVVDTCGYLPREVAALASRLRGRVGRLLFVSSVSVYASTAHGNAEDDALAALDDAERDTEVVDGRTYGPLKAACELALRQALGEAATVVRPGLIVGPHDPTQRFTYWPARLARARDGDAVLAPGRPDAPVQLIDARDLAAFLLRLLDDRRAGTFNAVGEPTTMQAVLQACADAAGVRPDWRWIDMATLQARGLQPWSDLPLALPEDAAHAGFMRTDTRRARAVGLATRPLATTVADTLAWWRALPAAAQAVDRAGLTPEREAQALA